MKKRLFVMILLLVLFFCFSLTFANESVDLMERSMVIKVPTFSQLTENDAYRMINETLYENSFSLLKTNSVDVETDFSDWDVVDYYSQATKTYTNHQLISFKMNQYLYTYRSAHGSHLYLGFVFDLETGGELALHDLFNKMDDFISTVNTMMHESIEKNEIPIFEFTDFQGLDDSAEFYLEDDLLVIVYQEYAYTPYVYGPLIFKIPLDELKAYLNSNYF